MSEPSPRAPARSRWSWQVGTLFGIDVRVHATLALLLAWIAVVHLMEGHGPLEVLHGVALVAAIFGIVLLHELGHALTARRFGIATHDITLLPIGGISRLERMPERPAQELLVAVAGPAVNVVLAGAALAIVALLRLPVMPRALLDVGGSLLAQLLWINVSLAAFNLLPAFPTDGGRALRALLAFRLPPVRATEIAARVGQVMAVAFALVGIVANWLLVLIAIFLYFGAAQEARWARLKAALAGLPVEAGMVRDPHALHAHESLRRAAGLAVAGAPACFPVEDEGRLVGVLTRSDLIGGLERVGPDAAVADVMHGQFAVVEAGTPLESALESARGGTPTVVERDGEIAGLLTAETIGDLMLLARALRA